MLLILGQGAERWFDPGAGQISEDYCAQTVTRTTNSTSVLDMHKYAVHCQADVNFIANDHAYHEQCSVFMSSKKICRANFERQKTMFAARLSIQWTVASLHPRFPSTADL